MMDWLVILVIFLVALAVNWPQLRQIRAERRRYRELKRRECELWRSGGAVEAPGRGVSAWCESRAQRRYRYVKAARRVALNPCEAREL